MNIVYGTGWCPKTNTIRNFLMQNWVDFEFRNVEEDPDAAQRVRDQYNGVLKFPVIEYDGTWYKNPGIPELREIFKL